MGKCTSKPVGDRHRVIELEAEVEDLKQQLQGANSLITAIERLYPNWHKFRDLAEAIQWHTNSQDKVIQRLREVIQDRVATDLQKLTPTGGN